VPHPRYSREEIARRGEEIYERRLREQIETDENIGKILSLDIETGDFALGTDPLETSRQLLSLNPGAATWTRRVGYDAVYALGGGTLTRTAP
jgi:hypothetical protein